MARTILFHQRIAFGLKHWQSGGGCPADSGVHWSRFAVFRQP